MGEYSCESRNSKLHRVAIHNVYLPSHVLSQDTVLQCHNHYNATQQYVQSVVVLFYEITYYWYISIYLSQRTDPNGIPLVYVFIYFI